MSDSAKHGPTPEEVKACGVEVEEDIREHLSDEAALIGYTLSETPDGKGLISVAVSFDISLRRRPPDEASSRLLPRPYRQLCFDDRILAEAELALRRHNRKQLRHLRISPGSPRPEA